MSEPSKIYRYPAVNPFQENQSMLFFGRKEETQRLSALIFSEKLTLLYGKSGYGKSSLLNAGILPKLHHENLVGKREYIPVPIRFQSAEAAGQSLMDKFRFHWKAAMDKAGISAATLTVPNLPDTLWGLFKTINPADNAVFVLLFDQFEEFFSYPLAQQEAFKEQLSELLYTTYPAFLRENKKRLDPEALDFLGRDLDVRAVFAIREDRLSELDRLSDRLPDIMRKRMKLTALDEVQARDAIREPALLPNTEGHFITPPFDYATPALDKMIAELSGSESKRIESFQLQIVCFSIEKKVGKEGLSKIEVQDLPDFANVYESYYRNQIDEIAEPELRETASRLLEYGLLFVDAASGEAHRRSVDSLELSQAFPGAARGLEALEKTYLIRREVNSFNRYSYEISHDTLLAPIVKSRKEKEALAEEKRKEAEQLEAERRALEAEAMAAEEKRRAEESERLKNEAVRGRTRARLFSILAVFVACIAIIEGIMAYIGQQQASASKADANAKLLIALEEKQQRLDLEIRDLQRKKQVYEAAENDYLIRENSGKLDSIAGLQNENAQAISQLKKQ